MVKTVIHPKQFPPAPLFLSTAILHNEPYVLEISGQLGLDPKTGKMIEGGIKAQTEQTLNNVQAVLEEVGWTLENVVKARVFLTDMKDYVAFNDVYAKRFPKNPPARFALAVKALPFDALVEIECTAGGDKISKT